MQTFAVVSFVLILTINVNSQENSLFCINEHLVDNKKNISDIEYQSSTVKCLTRLEGGAVQFTIAPPNEAMLGSTFSTDNTTVMGYFRRAEIDLDTSLNTIVVTKGKLKLDNIKELKYCHPGESLNISPSISRELLIAISRSNNGFNCSNDNVTLPEYFYQHLNLTLGPSCIPVQWTANDTLDASLKKRFPKLLELCKTYDKNLDPFEQSLKCVIDGKGDIALTSLEKLHQARNKMLTKKDEYYSLCKDGIWQPIDNPCVWSKQSWPLLLANKNYSDRLNRVQEILEEISFGNLTTNETFTSKPIPLSAYMKNFREIPVLDDKTICNRGLIWCTLTEEETKYCEMLRQSFLIYGIWPAIKSCKKPNAEHLDNYECIHNTYKRLTNIAFVGSDQLYTAERRNLEVVMYTNNEKQNLTRSVLIVNEKDIPTINDLYNKRACFSEFGSIDWLSFVSVFKGHILNTSCIYDKELSMFVGDSCMPGINDKRRVASENNSTDRVTKMCEGSFSSSTADNWNANDTVNRYATSNGAMTCLLEKSGQYAVIKLEELNKEYIANISSSRELKVMCKDGKLVKLTEDMDKNCYLSTTPSGAIVANKTIADDFKLVVLELKKLGLNQTLFPLNIFSEANNLLFDGSVQSFYNVELCNGTENNENCKYIKEISTLVEEIDKCPSQITRTFSANGSISTWVIAIVTIVLLCVVIGAAGYYGYKHWQGITGTTTGTPTATTYPTCRFTKVNSEQSES